MKNMIKWIFFDMNNVIEDFQSYKVNAYKELPTIIDECYPSLNHKEVEEKIGIIRNELEYLFGNAPFEHHYIFWDDIYTKLFGHPPDSSELNNLYNRYMAYYLDNIKIYDDAKEAIKNLEKDGYNMGIIANGGSLRVRSFISKYKLISFFKFITTSGDYYFKKPEKQIFDYSMNRQGIKPLNAVMVGDRLDNDILGANNAGIWSVLIKRNNIVNRPEVSLKISPDDVIENLNDISSCWMFKIKKKVNTAIILAGGRGKRMGSLTNNTQKCLLTIAGKPIIEHQIRRMIKAGISKIIIITNYKHEQLFNYISNQDYNSICKVIKTHETSTGMALANVIDEIDEQFVFTHGDVYFSQSDFFNLIKQYYKYSLNHTISGILSIVGCENNLTHAIVQEEDDNNLTIVYDKPYERNDIKKTGSAFSFGLGILEKSFIKRKNEITDENIMTENLIKYDNLKTPLKAYKLEQMYFHIETPSDYCNINNNLSNDQLIIY